MKSIFISQSNYIPWKGYFDAINSADEFILYDEMQYTKNDWRNRNKIKTPQGAVWLTIPVRQNNLGQKISESKTTNNLWQKSHWNSLVSNYNKSKYFKMYKDRFYSLYFDHESDFLSDINVRFLKAICEILDIKTTFISSADLTLQGDKSERIVNICKNRGAQNYLSGPSAKNYLDEKLFTDNNLNIKFMDYTGYPPYEQLYGDYIGEVSVIDLLFNNGPDSKKYMKSFA